MSRVIDTFGRVDVLVNNAGVNIPRDALEVTEADWDGVLDVNLKGCFLCRRRVARSMIETGGGKIVNIASQNGVVGYYKRAAYCSSKAGVVNSDAGVGCGMGALSDYGECRGSDVYFDAFDTIDV